MRMKVGGNGWLGRRMVVMVKVDGGWLVRMGVDEKDKVMVRMDGWEEG